MRLIGVFAALALVLGGCVTGIHREAAAGRMPRPTAPAADLLAYAAPSPDFPSIGGDILRGASPEALAAARAAATKPLNDPKTP